MLNKTDIEVNCKKIQVLQNKYLKKLKGSVKLRGELFLIEIREANSILDKIHTLRRKNEFLAKGLPSNGYKEDFSDFNVLE